MKKYFFSVAIFATLLFAACGEEPNGDWVEINGVKWAKCNVDAFGTFVFTPESFGVFNFDYYSFSINHQNQSSNVIRNF